MALSKTTIANLALANLHTRQSIEDLDSEQTVEAGAARLWYDVARRETLSMFNWPFARSRQLLAVHDVSEDGTNWEFRYQWPSDCVTPRFIVNPSGDDKVPIPFEVENAGDGTQCILCNLDEARLVYTRDEEDVDLFTPAFVPSFAFNLAFYMSGTLTHKKSLQAEMRKNFLQSLPLAASIAANASVAKPQAEASWIAGRNG